MRISLPALLICLSLPVAVLADPTEPELMAQAQRAYLSADYTAARELFSQVIEMDPNNTLAIQYLRNIRQLAPAGAAKQKSPLETLVLPSIDFKNATFSASLDFLKQAAAQQSVKVSFVTQLPAAQAAQPVTLNLSNIPFLEALRYLCQLNNSTFTVEPYAIVIKPAVADSGASGSPSP